MEEGKKPEPFDFGPLADANISRYTAAFLYIDSGNPKLAGSGTLVKCGKAQGIVTAAHVIDFISGQNEIGICVFPVRTAARQQAKVAVNALLANAVILYDKTLPGEGPDLAFLRLPDEMMSSLAASASIVDLDLHASKAGCPRPDASEAFEAISGAIGSMTPPAVKRGNLVVLRVQGLVNVGQIFPVGDNTLGYDLLSFRPKAENGFQLPESYKGTSGGGVWRIYVQRQNDGNYVVVDRRFVGVAFQQFGEKIQSHGVSSLYQRLVPEIRKRWH